MKNKIMLIINLAFLFLFIYLLKDIDFYLFFNNFKNINIHIWIIVFLLFFLSYLMKSIRLLILNENMNLKNMFLVVVKHNFFLTLLPMKLGELIYLNELKKHKIKLTKSFSDLIIIRLYDIILILSISIFFLKDIINFSKLNILFLILFYITFIIIIFFSDKITKVLHFKTKYNLLKKSLDFIKNSLKIISEVNFKKKIYLFFITFLVWLFSFLPWIFLFSNLFDLNITKYFLILIPTIAITFLPINPPGGVGTIHSGWIIGFLLVNFSYIDAVNYSVFLHATFIIQLTIIFYICFLIEKLFTNKFKKS